MRDKDNNPISAKISNLHNYDKAVKLCKFNKKFNYYDTQVTATPIKDKNKYYLYTENKYGVLTDESVLTIASDKFTSTSNSDQVLENLDDVKSLFSNDDAAVVKIMEDNSGYLAN